MPETTNSVVVPTASTRKAMTNRDKAVLILLAVAVIGAISFGAYWFMIKVQPKAVSIISQFSEALTVEINGETHNVQPYANYAAEVMTGDKITVVAKNAAGDVVYQKEQTVGRNHGLWLNIISPEETKEENKKCFGEGDMADMFYKKETSVSLEGSVADIKSFKVLSDTAVEDYYYSLGNFFNGFTSTWVFPGRMDYADLPDEIDVGDSITGVFYFNCEDKEDITVVSEQAYGIVSFETNFEDYLSQWEEEGTI